MKEIKVTRTTDKRSAAYKIGRSIGAILTIGIGILLISGIVWGIVAIWRAVIG